VGDVQFQKKCLGKMGEVSKSGRTILFVSHNMGAVEQLCNRCMVLNRGQLTMLTDSVAAGIKSYLNNNMGKVECVWIKDDKISPNPHFTPLSMRLLNENGHVASNCFGNNENITLEIISEIKDYSDLLQVGYALFSDDDQQMLYWSTHTDGAESSWAKLSNGTYRFTTQLPRRLLNEGCYRIELLVSLYYREWLFYPGNNVPAIRFEIGGGLSDSPYWPHKRPGVLAPVFNWNATRHDGAVDAGNS